MFNIPQGTRLSSPRHCRREATLTDVYHDFIRNKRKTDGEMCTDTREKMAGGGILEELEREREREK